MSLNGFTGWLFSALLSWMQIIYNWLWSMLASGGQNEFMPWFSDNWARIALILIVAGLIIDYTVYLMRWQPYHIWLNTLRRARGAVMRPFKKEQPKQHYAGYRRVLEGADEMPRTARAPRQDQRPVRTYEAAPVEAQRRTQAQNARPVQPERQMPMQNARPVQAQPARQMPTQNARPVQAQPAYNAQPARTAQPTRAAQGERGRIIMQGETHVWPARESAPAARDTQREVQTYEARPVAVRPANAQPAVAVQPVRQNARPVQNAQPAQSARPVQSAQPIQNDVRSTALDAEGYVPESVQSADEPLFSAPPEFARSSAAPVYGRVYQGAHQPILPLGVDPESSRPQMQLPELPAEARAAQAAQAASTAQDNRPRGVQTEDVAPQQSAPARPSIAVKPLEREQTRPRKISVREAEGGKFIGFDE